jgi:glycosyltransferase involved in cell wall biosynthesis
MSRLIPLRIKETINGATGRKVFDLSFYLQFQPRSIIVEPPPVEAPDYAPITGGKVRVALITPHLHPGGAETVLLQIANSLDRREYEISVIATHPGETSWRDRWEQAVDYVYDLQGSGSVYSLVISRQYQFILMQNTLYAYSAAPAIRAALPSCHIMDLIHSIDDDWDIVSATKGVSGAFDCRLAVSETVAARIRDQKVRVVRHGIDTWRFRPSDARTEPRPYRILFAGRLDPVKRVLLLPEIAAELNRIRPQRDFRFIVAGDGPDAPALHKRVERMQLTSCFEFLGHVADMAPVMRDSDLLLLTSSSEGIPLAVLEAMACAKPVVSSNVGAVSEVLLHGRTGVLIENGEYAAAIHDLLEAPDLRREMGIQGREYVETHFSLQAAERAYRDLFATVTLDAC